MKASKLITILFTLLFPALAEAQQGLFLSFQGMFEQSNIYARDDIYNYGLDLKPKYAPGGGIALIYNFSENYGWRTGLVYSAQGERYTGQVYAHDTGDLLIKFNSEVNLHYLKLPLMFQFNSQFGPKEGSNLSIAAGFNVSYLLSASSQTSPPPDSGNVNLHPNIADFYKPLNVSFAALASFNIYLKKRSSLSFGISFDRSLGDIENKKFNYSGKNYPREYYFPISTKKSTTPDITTRSPAKNVTVALFFSYTYRLSDLKGNKNRRR